MEVAQGGTREKEDHPNDMAVSYNIWYTVLEDMTADPHHPVD